MVAIEAKTELQSNYWLTLKNLKYVNQNVKFFYLSCLVVLNLKQVF